MANTGVVRNIVLVGRTGNGKSATGNSIIGNNKAFKTGATLSSVTKTSSMKETIITDEDDVDYTVRVIDTPGLFDGTSSIEELSKEIVKCMQLAREGIHAFIVVLSTRSRFSEEEAESLNHLERLFGSKAVERMILVFTRGDEFQDVNQWTRYLSSAPDHLRKFLYKCHNRVVLFDNVTRDENKKENQRGELLNLVNVVVQANKGMPYTNEIFEKVKLGEMKKPGMPKRPPTMLSEHLKPAVEEIKTKLLQEISARSGRKKEDPNCSIM